MDLGLAGKVAVVTGSSRGIGRGVAEFLAKEGCDIVLHGRDKAALAEVEAAVKKAGRKTLTVVNDLSKDGSHQALVAETQKAFGKIDILVNNAGATKRGDFRQLTDQDWKDGFELKFFSRRGASWESCARPWSSALAAIPPFPRSWRRHCAVFPRCSTSRTA